MNSPTYLTDLTNLDLRRTRNDTLIKVQRDKRWPFPPLAAHCKCPVVWLTTKALPFGKVSSRLCLSKVSPDPWLVTLKLVSLRWHTASPRSNNGSRITARIRTSHGALISRNYLDENRDFPSCATQLRPSPPGRSRDREHFQKTREHPSQLRRNIALTSCAREATRKQRCRSVTDPVFASRIVTSTSTRDDLIHQQTDIEGKT